MARFDVYEGEGGSYLLDCQADILSDLKTRFVIPLIPTSEVERLAAKLNPIFEIGESSYVMATNLAAAVPASMLNRRVTSLRTDDGAIGNAIDMLLFGF